MEKGLMSSSFLWLSFPASTGLSPMALSLLTSVFPVPVLSRCTLVDPAPSPVLYSLPTPKNLPKDQNKFLLTVHIRYVCVQREAQHIQPATKQIKIIYY